MKSAAAIQYPRIISAIRTARWAVRPETLQAITDALNSRALGKVHRRADMDMPELDDGAEMDAPSAAKYERAGPVAVVQLHGIIGKRLSSLEMACGGCDLERVEEAATAAFADPEVAALILDIDSPGGTVSGVDEFRQTLADMSIQSGKPVLAFASGMCCSAAYWIACGCSAGICATTSSDVGSIGVYCAFVDESAAWEKEGLRLVLIKAGEQKAAGIAGSKITDEQAAAWQSDVDFIYGKFTGSVKAARGGISNDVLQGQTFYGERAVAAGLCDAVYKDLAACLADFAGTR